MIVDSERLKLEAFSELYADQSQEVVDQVIGYLKEHAGISRVVKILHCHREFLGTALTDEEHEALCNAYAAIVEEKVFSCPEIAGATNFLQTFQDRGRFFVVSGTPENELRRITKHRELDPYFVAVYGSPRLKDVIVNDVLKRREIPPGECLLVMQ